MASLSKNFGLIKNALLKRPVLCLWQITRRCNFTCRICHIWQEAHRRENELTIDQIETLMDRLRPMAPMMMTLAGGEPLLREDVAKIVKVVSRDHFCSIVTNGWLMTRDIAEDLYRNGLTDAMVSIDYSTPEKHDLQRGCPGAFKHAVSALEALRDSRPGKRHKVRILTVLTNDNLEELEGLLLIAEELSVSFALTLYSNNLGRKPDYYPPKHVSEYLLELKRRHRIFETATPYLSFFDTALEATGVADCGGGKTFINMDESGAIARCVDRNDQPAGNPFTNTTEDILYSLKSQRKVTPCTGCWTSCRGIGDIITGMGGIKTYPDFFKTRKPM